MKLTSTGVYRIAPGEDPAQVLDGSPLLDVAVQEGDPPHDLLVGAFAHEDGRRAVLINNYRTCLSAWLTVTFDAPMQEVREVDRWSGEEVPLLDESPNIEGMQLSLDAGAGRLFLLPAEE
jgi:hypothetical protein